MALTGLSAVFPFEMLDGSVLTVPLPTSAGDPGSSTTGSQWVPGACSVAFGGLMLLFGALAERVSRRRVMRSGLVLLAAAPWQVLLLVDAPIALLAFIGIRLVSIG
ncbi:hypothetical protein [Clavibacter michiganensis]|uniref:hypothetical protein n=1 Tax=Clavibacter michiganensis TaxID=28447 RepID=UPI0005B99539|nr:hypothetical protein [Clavibacter michiganensis]